MTGTVTARPTVGAPTTETASDGSSGVKFATMVSGEFTVTMSGLLALVGTHPAEVGEREEGVGCSGDGGLGARRVATASRHRPGARRIDVFVPVTSWQEIGGDGGRDQSPSRGGGWSGLVVPL